MEQIPRQMVGGLVAERPVRSRRADRRRGLVAVFRELDARPAREVTRGP